MVVSKPPTSLKANIKFSKPAAPNAGLLNEVVLLQHWQNYSQRAEGGSGGRRHHRTLSSRLLAPSRQGGWEPVESDTARHTRPLVVTMTFLQLAKTTGDPGPLLGLAQRRPNLASFGSIQPPLWVSIDFSSILHQLLCLAVGRTQPFSSLTSFNFDRENFPLSVFLVSKLGISHDSDAALSCRFKKKC